MDWVMVWHASRFDSFVPKWPNWSCASLLSSSSIYCWLASNVYKSDTSGSRLKVPFAVTHHTYIYINTEQLCCTMNTCDFVLRLPDNWLMGPFMSHTGKDVKIRAISAPSTKETQSYILSQMSTNNLQSRWICGRDEYIELVQVSLSAPLETHKLLEALLL